MSAARLMHEVNRKCAVEMQRLKTLTLYQAFWVCW